MCSVVEYTSLHYCEQVPDGNIKCNNLIVFCQTNLCFLGKQPVQSDSGKNKGET